MAVSSDGKVDVFWKDPGVISITSWQFQYLYETSLTSQTSAWATIPDSSASTSTHEFTALSGSTTTRVCVKIRAVNVNGAGAESTRTCEDRKDEQITFSVEDDDVNVVEGDSGYTDVTVKVSLSQKVHSDGLPILIDLTGRSNTYSSASQASNCSSPGSSDYCIIASGVSGNYDNVKVAGGAKSATFKVRVFGDITAESDETILL